TLSERTEELTGNSSARQLQVDMAMDLKGKQISQLVGMETAKAAELMLRLTPYPDGLPYISAYREAFKTRYGLDRQVPLLELLTPDSGLGYPGKNFESWKPSENPKRAERLMDLAIDSLHSRKRILELDARMIADLQTWTPTPETAPLSLDI